MCIMKPAGKAPCKYFAYLSDDGEMFYWEGQITPDKFNADTGSGLTVTRTEPALDAEYAQEIREFSVLFSALAIAGTEQMISESGIADISIEDFGFESVTAAG